MASVQILAAVLGAFQDRHSPILAERTNMVGDDVPGQLRID